MKTRTYLSGGPNTRGSEVTAANAKFAHLRGWNAGVRVTAGIDEEGRDVFHVYVTSGSHGGANDNHVGTVTDTADGPLWEVDE